MKSTVCEVLISEKETLKKTKKNNKVLFTLLPEVITLYNKINVSLSTQDTQRIWKK